ncbi:MAG: MSMEG_6728 family protein [Acidiferrobacteraceae bacterium]
MEYKVITFLPYPNFGDCAAVLDRERLGKQRLEAKQLVLTLEGHTRWTAHPAARMWRGFEPVLALYGFAVCTEWRRRGYLDNMREFFGSRIPKRDFDAPTWLGDSALHESHRSNLIRKLPAWYGKLWPETPDNLQYVWPEAA